MAEEYNTLKERLEAIRDERGLHRNTATRIGGAFLALLDYLRDNVAGKYLSKVYADTAAGLITFSAGLTSNVKSWFKRGIKVGGQESVYGIDEGGVVTSDGVRSSTYDDDLIGGYGYHVYKDSQGNGHVCTDYLDVRKKGRYAEIEIRRLSYINAENIQSEAASKVAVMLPVGIDGEILSGNYTENDIWAYRCLAIDDDGSTATTNSWKAGDQCRCQTFNIKEGTSYHASNRYYWRLVIRTGSGFEYEGKSYYWFEVAAEGGGHEICYNDNTTLYAQLRAEYLEGYPEATDADTHIFSAWEQTQVEENGVTSFQNPNDVPAADDVVVQMGSQTNPERMGFNISRSDGLDTGYYVYAGVNNYVLEGKMLTKLSPRTILFSTRHFRLFSDPNAGDPTPLTRYRGDWQQGYISYYYDEWDYQGSRWLCLYQGAEGITCAPGEMPSNAPQGATVADYWKQISLKGEKGDSVLTGYCDYFHGVDWNGGTRPEASETTVGAVDLLDYHGNNEDMIDVGEEISGSYSWEGHSVPLGSRYMMRGGDFAIYVATANGWIREGKNGTDGASVSYDAEHSSLQYAVSQYGTAGSGRSYPSDISSWQDTMPAVQKGKYLWTKDTTAYNNDGTIVYDVTYGVTYWPQDGESVEIDTDNTFVKYSTVKTAARPADNTFTLSSPPSLSQGDYLWSLTQVKYVGFDPLKSYSVSRVGTDGYDGDPGSDGYTTHFAYAKLKSGQSIPTSGKLTTAMVDQWARANFAGADAIGTYRDQTGTDSTNISSYTWTKWKGDKGDDGASVMAQYAPNSSPSSSQIHDTWQSGDIYMRTKSTSESSWSSWHKIVGESGGETDYTFNISSVLATNNPSDPTIEPSPCGLLEWADAPVATTSTYPYLWMRIVKKTWNASTQSYTSGTPKYIRITGKDGNTTQTVTVYKRSDTQPATPTGSTIPPMGWSTSVPVMCSGDFSDITSGDYKGWRKATGDDNNGAFIKDTITFVTTSPNEVVRIAIKASSEEDYDFIFVGNLDANYASRPQDMDDISDSRKASGSELKIVETTVSTASEHTLCVIYTKDGSSHDGMDCGWYKVINMENIVWSSMATFKNDILQGSWSTPVRWNGSDGDDGYSVTLTPSTIIINQSEELTTVGGVKDYYLDYTNATAILEVKKGGVPVDASITRSTDGTCSVPTITHQSTGRYLITMGAVNKHSGNTYVDTADGATRTRYYDKGRITINVTPNGASETTRLYFDFRCNLQGTLKTTIKGDVETTVAEKITYGYNNETGSVGSLQAVGKYIRSSEKNIAQLTETVTNNSIANEKNLFGFTRNISYDGAVPFVQGYGFVATYNNSQQYGRIYNVKLNDGAGYYVVSCEAKVQTAGKIRLRLGDVDPVSGSGLEADENDNDILKVPATTSWKKVVAVFNLTAAQAADSNGALVIRGGSSSNYVFIRYLQIERGSTPSLFGICAEDAANNSEPMHVTWNQSPSGGMFFDVTSGNNGPGGTSKYTTNRVYPSRSPQYPEGTGYIELIKGDLVMTEGIYTLSFWARASVNESVMECFCYDATNTETYKGVVAYCDGLGMYYGEIDPNQTEGMSYWGSTRIELTTAWKKYYVHWYMTGASSKIHVIPIRINGADTGGDSIDYYIAQIKLERGYVTSANRTVYETVMKQTARRMDFSVLVNSMEKAGIHLYTSNNTTPESENEIDEGVIDLAAGKVNFVDPNGNPYASPKVAINPTTGVFETVDARLSGNLYTPYKRLTSSNISSYRLTNFAGETVVNLSSTGLNLQVEVAVELRLPEITADMLGCEVNIFNATTSMLTITGSGNTTSSSSDKYCANLIIPSTASNLGTNGSVGLQKYREAKFKAVYTGYSSIQQYAWLCCFANINP